MHIFTKDGRPFIWDITPRQFEAVKTLWTHNIMRSASVLVHPVEKPGEYKILQIDQIDWDRSKRLTTNSDPPMAAV